MIDHEVISVGARVDGIREKARAVRAEGRKNWRHLSAGEVARQDDAMLDVDVEEVGRHLQVGHRLPHHAAAVVPRFFRYERLRPESDRDRAADRRSPHLERHDVAARVAQEIRAHRGEKRLTE